MQVHCPRNVSSKCLWDPDGSSKVTYDNKVDIFAYAITVWVLASRTNPYPDLLGTSKDSDRTRAERELKFFIKVKKDHMRPTPPRETFPAEFCDLLEACWSLSLSSDLLSKRLWYEPYQERSGYM